MEVKHNVYGLIYKITNIVNGKVYIGQTIQGLNTRIRRHFRDAENGKNTVLCRAIRKYGEENFYWEIMDTASNYEELNSKEIKWIIDYNSHVTSKNSNGYNMKIGGSCLPIELNSITKFSRELIEEILELSKTGKYSIEKLVQEFNLSKSSMNNLFDQNYTWHKTILEIVSEEEFNFILSQLRECGKKTASEKISRLKAGENHHMWGRKGSNNPKSKPVLQIDKDTEQVLKEFASATEASKYLNACNSSKIAMVCRGERKTAYGYKWSFKTAI